MYDKGARIQEVADWIISSIGIKVETTTQLIDNSNKIHILPLTPQALEILKSYMKRNSLLLIESNIFKSLFFNKSNVKLIRAVISYILNKYVVLESAANLIYIRNFLEHNSVTTTKIYTKSNPEIKRKIIEQIGVSVLPNEPFPKDKKQKLLD